jgi:hypothetical protein
MFTGQRAWRAAIRNVCNSLRQRRGRRLRNRRDIGSPHGWDVAAEVMEERALLSGPAMGTAFSSIFQDVSTPSGTSTGVADNTHPRATDSAGNVYVTSTYSGTGNINPLGPAYTVTDTSVDSPTGAFILEAPLLAKYDTNFNLQWALAPTFTADAGSTSAGGSFGSMTGG